MYTPAILPSDNLTSLVAALQQELVRISGELSQTDPTGAGTRFLAAAPDKPREGTLAQADGTNWNPGYGKGTYQLIGGVWVPQFVTTATLGLYAPLASPTFTGDPKAPTPAAQDSDTSLATTAFVQALLTGGAANQNANRVFAGPGSGGAAVPGFRALVAADLPLTVIANSLAADVTLNNTANYFTGPSCAQGTSGVWFASGTVSIVDTVGAATFDIKLWDGTTVIASLRFNTASASIQAVGLSGFISNPAGNIRISVKDRTATTGTIRANATGESHDSTLTVVQIG